MQENLEIDKKRKLEINVYEAKFAHMNTRNEGNEKAPKRAADLKFQGHCDGAILRVLMGSDDIPPLWNTEGAPLYTGISKITSKTELEGCTLRFGDLDISIITLKGVDVNDFSYVPISGRAIKVSFRVQVRYTDEELVLLSKACWKTASLEIDAILGYKGEDASHLIRHADEQAEDEDDQQDAFDDQQQDDDEGPTSDSQPDPVAAEFARAKGKTSKKRKAATH